MLVYCKDADYSSDELTVPHVYDSRPQLLL